jgi:hypothetical protein
MSISYWVIEGVGIEADKIWPYLNYDKVLDVLYDLMPNNKNIAKLFVERKDTGKCPEFDIDDFVDGQLFDSLADLLTFCDDTDTITYGYDGERDYFYYPPSMPWERVEADPETREEVHQRIITAIQKVADLAAEEIDGMIDDDLYVVGEG